MEPGNVPYASRATSYPKQQHDTFAFLPLFSISTLIKTSKILMTPHHESAFPDYPSPFTNKKKTKQKIVFPNTPTRIPAPQSKLYSHTHVHAYHEGSGFKNPSLVP